MYRCPHCDLEVERMVKSEPPFGWIGTLWMSAFATYECRTCGIIPRSQFGWVEQVGMNIRSAVLVVCACALTGVAVWLIGWRILW